MFCAGEALPEDIPALAGCDQVAATVAANASAIGYCLYRQRPVEGVRTVAIAREKKGGFVLPTDENVFSHKYPLAEELFLITRADASESAKAYCRFATGPEGAKIAKKWFLYPEYDRRQWLAKQRVVRVKSGKAPAVSVAGLAVWEALAKDLGLKYVEAEAAVAVHYHAKSAASEAARQFLDGKAELLLVEGDGQGARARGEGRVEMQGKDVRKIVLGRAAIGIVANPRTLLTSISMDELRQICTGKIRSWPGEKGAAAAIHIFGLQPGDPAMRIYRNELGQKGGGRARARGEGEGRPARTETRSRRGAGR